MSRRKKLTTIKRVEKTHSSPSAARHFAERYYFPNHIPSGRRLKVVFSRCATNRTIAYIYTHAYTLRSRVLFFIPVHQINVITENSGDNFIVSDRLTRLQRNADGSNPWFVCTSRHRILGAVSIATCAFITGNKFCTIIIPSSCCKCNVVRRTHAVRSIRLYTFNNYVRFYVFLVGPTHLSLSRTVLFVHLSRPLLSTAPFNE